MARSNTMGGKAHYEGEDEAESENANGTNKTWLSMVT